MRSKDAQVVATRRQYNNGNPGKPGLKYFNK
jgi:hypothetical protein